MEEMRKGDKVKGQDGGMENKAGNITPINRTN
jgi:hypothetical protein